MFHRLFFQNVQKKSFLTAPKSIVSSLDFIKPLKFTSLNPLVSLAPDFNGCIPLDDGRPISWKVQEYLISLGAGDLRS